MFERKCLSGWTNAPRRGAANQTKQGLDNALVLILQLAG